MENFKHKVWETWDLLRQVRAKALWELRSHRGQTGWTNFEIQELSKERFPGAKKPNQENLRQFAQECMWFFHAQPLDGLSGFALAEYQRQQNEAGERGIEIYCYLRQQETQSE